jgi:hypothetical protein
MLEPPKLASLEYSRSAAQLNSRLEMSPVPVRANGEPGVTAVSEPSALMEYTETLVSFETAKSFPLAETFMPTVGEQQLAVVAAGVRIPLAATANVLICPLLEAIRNRR